MSVVGHSTIWQENVKEKGLDYLHFSCALDVLPALQFQPIIICINFIEETEIWQHGLPSLCCPSPWISLDLWRREDLLPLGKPPPLLVISSFPISSMALFSYSHPSMKFQSSLLAWLLLNLQTCPIFLIPVQMSHLFSFFYYQTFTFKPKSAPSTLLKGSCHRSPWPCCTQIPWPFLCSCPLWPQ